jgi:hypothetical protein
MQGPLEKQKTKASAFPLRRATLTAKAAVKHASRSFENRGNQSSTAKGEVLQDQQNNFGTKINARACRGG